MEIRSGGRPTLKGSRALKIASGKLPELDPGAIRVHFIKHSISDLLLDAVAIVDDLADTLQGTAPEAGRLSPQWHADQVLSRLADWFRADLKNPGAGRKNARQIFEDRKREARRSSSETPEERKWRGFYVDPTRPLDEQPNAVPEEDAWQELMELRRAISATRWIKTHLAEEAPLADRGSKADRI